MTAVDAVMARLRHRRRSAGWAAIDVAEAERHLADGQFPAGSMGPKVRAATRFLRDGGRSAVITTPALAAATLASPQRTTPASAPGSCRR